MKFRLLTHSLILVLFVTASMMAAWVAPVKAGFVPMERDVMAAMSVDMPCCPNGNDKQSDCTTGCLAVSFCLVKCFASTPTVFGAIVQPLVVTLGLAGDEMLRISPPSEPPARPPRT
ncbi:hypothetical protein ACFONL_21335 [Camelimonas fluminis]|uniref:Uncharacterized protein n=1 Tax=Camelimonas fluminis TaxID=1576911 RepID=A0ABV7UP31_9HYPH|nr:hypothetical protein [Camelimonas fluminis]